MAEATLTPGAVSTARTASPGGWVAPAAGVLTAAVLLAPLLAVLRAHAPLVLEDDGYYYAVIARNLARTGRSTFDGAGLTNGYHPLWLLLVTLKARLFGDGVGAILLAEAACVGAGAAVLLRSAGVRAWAPAALFTVLWAHYVGAMSMAGMEVSLLAVCAAVFVARLYAGTGGAGRWDGLGLGVASAACIGARIDSAVFVLPALLLCGRTRRARGMALAVLAVGGSIYAGVNLAVFGAALPISSAVKSLGGLQVNVRYLHQLALDAATLGRGGHGRLVLALVGFAVAPLAALLHPRGSTARTLGLACGIGGALFFCKLAFDSSWQVWPWYGFPLIFLLAAALFALGPAAARLCTPRAGEGAAGRSGPALSVVAALAVAVLAARAGRQALSPPLSPGFYAVNTAAAARFAAITGGAPVGMGDRAGSFAWAYPGPVVQLEGLVNDAAWLRLLKTRGDARAMLCARGVRYMAAYQPPLGRYDRLVVPVMRPALTQYPAPGVEVHAADELAAVGDPALYASVEDGDDTLHLWRLRCGAAR